MRHAAALAVAFAAGFLALRLIVLAGRDLLHAPALARPNYRDHQVATAAGLFVVLAVLVVESGRVLLGAFGLGDDPGANPYRPLVLFACLGFGLLGLADDLVGTGADRGFRGHLRALTEGRLTTGLAKLVGGAAIALVLSADVPEGFVTAKRLVSDAVLIALAANLANLFDRAPGRAIKAGIVAWLPLAFVVGGGSRGVAFAPALGAFTALLGDDLRERVMLGDTGANVLGALIGLEIVLGVGRGARNWILAALLALNVLAEFVKFSAVIDAVPPLRAFDRLGRRRGSAPPATGP